MGNSITKRILVVGETFIDENIIGDADRLSPEAPVPIIYNGKSTIDLGGAGNVAKNISNLGGNVSLLTLLGDDSYSTKVRGLAKKYGFEILNTEFKLKSTMQKTRYIVQQQQLLRYDVEEIINKEAAEYIANYLYNICNNYEIFVFSDYKKGLFSVIQTKKLKSMINDRIILVDSKTGSKEIISNATFLKPNKSEFLKICLSNKIEKLQLEDQISYLIKNFNIENILLTLGDEGMILATSSQDKIKFTRIAGNQREVFDVTGAGDTVISVLAYGLKIGIGIEELAKKANFIASKAVGHLGNYTPSKDDLNQDGKNIVFTNGCFDILHIGHIELLNKCRKLGGKVIVGLNSDSSVKKLKGINRPFNNEQVRKTILESLNSVDEVIIFKEDNPYKLIEEINPDIIVKGGDYDVEDVIGKDIVRRKNGKVIIFPFVKGYSTTKLANKIVKTE